MTDEKPLSFAERRRQLAEARGRTLDEPPKKPDLKVVPKADADLIPDVLGERTEEDVQIDNIISSLDIVEAYRKWIGKAVDEKTTNKREGIVVSCPLPGHADPPPRLNAWLNSDSKTFFCGKCQEGGDIYDIAAIHFAYDRPGYKDGSNFHKLRRDMAESFGWRFKDVAGGSVVWREGDGVASDDSPDGEADAKQSKQAVVQDDAQDSPQGSAVSDGTTTSEAVPNGISDAAVAAPVLGGTVTVLREEDVADLLEDEIGYPSLNWKAVVPEDTFLYEYCKATANDDAPEEYHFWHGLLALGHAVGRNVFLNDTRPVYSNLLVCLLGGTGFGKSRSRGWLDEVIEEVLPFRNNGLDTTGCKIVPVPASGENLIKQFEHIAADPSLPKGTPLVHTPINGVVDYDEFASLLARASRQGSTLKQIIMGFSDARTRVTTSSNTGGDLEAYKPFASITASTQPKAVRKLLTSTDTGSGFLNRWIFVGGPRKKREVMGGVHSSIRVDLSGACTLLKAVRGWGAMERDIRFEEDALDEFDRFMREDVFKVQVADETDLLTRLDLTMKRLVLLFCINERKTAVTLEIVRHVEPILEYMIQCYGILNAEIGVSQMTEITTEIMRHIKNIETKTQRGASARDLTVRMHRKNYSPDLLKRALETMVALDWIDVEKTKGVGRPTIRYKAVK